MEEEGKREGADCRLSWQLPGGGYDENFPLVHLSSDMQATVELHGTPDTMALYNRHVQVEAVFNRGLKVKKKELMDGQLKVGVTGGADRMKSFVRWCYNGPRLEKADRVSVIWGEL